MDQSRGRLIDYPSLLRSDFSMMYYVGEPISYPGSSVGSTTCFMTKVVLECLRKAFCGVLHGPHFILSWKHLPLVKLLYSQKTTK